MSSGSFVSINHGIGLNQYHFEWCPKYRFKCMRRPEIAVEMEQILRQIARDKGMILHDIVVDNDHVHLLISIPFSMSVSQAMQFLKGGSAYQIFRLHPNFRLRYPAGHFWSPGHFSRSVSSVSFKTVQHYFDKHDNGGLQQTINEAKVEAHQLQLAEFS